MYATTFRMFARYNAWANERTYAATRVLPADRRWEDRGLFFRSVMGTLNHLLVTDRVWMKRFTGEGQAPDRLDAILFESFEELLAARRAEDTRIVDWIDDMDDAAFGTSFSYRPITNPRDITQSYAPVLFHLFNHQTHHRGQCHGALTGLGVDAPVLDLVAFQREAGIGSS